MFLLKQLHSKVIDSLPSMESDENSSVLLIACLVTKDVYFLALTHCS